MTAAGEVDDLGPQRVRHRPSGAEVFTAARDRIGYTLDGRTWTPYRERLTDGDSIVMSARPSWDDGTELSHDELDRAGDAIAAALHRWGAARVEIVWPDDTAEQR